MPKIVTFNGTLPNSFSRSIKVYQSLDFIKINKNCMICFYLNSFPVAYNYTDCNISFDLIRR